MSIGRSAGVEGQDSSAVQNLDGVRCRPAGRSCIMWSMPVHDQRPSSSLPASETRAGGNDGGALDWNPILSTVGVVALAVALLWAGTHQLGSLYAERPTFSSLQWIASLSLIAAAGFVFVNAWRPLDVRAAIDWTKLISVVAIPLIVLAWCWVSLEFQADNGLLDMLFTWASPFGHGVLAAMVGIGATAGVQTRR